MFIYIPILMAIFFPIFDGPFRGIESCFSMIFVMVMLIGPVLIAVYLGDLFLNRHFRRVLIKDNNFRNSRLRINTIAPHVELRDLELSLGETNKTQISIVQIRYTSVKKLKISLGQEKDEPTWSFDKTNPPLGADEKTLMEDQLKFLYSNGYHVLSIYNATVTIRLGEYDIKQFHWFIMYMRELLFELERRVRSGEVISK
jgi:hypothetical protein